MREPIYVEERVHDSVLIFSEKLIFLLASRDLDSLGTIKPHIRMHDPPVKVCIFQFSERINEILEFSLISL